MSFSADELADRALGAFWKGGYNATSMDALVKSTGVSRHAIYATFGGKKGLFQACFARYQALVVTPAFSVVEEADADLDSIAAYFETQIAGAEAAGLPGPGCFVANTATEVAPHDADANARVAEHNDRLRRGFHHALTNASTAGTVPAAATALADVCVVFANGLWSMSRVTDNAGTLRQSVDLFLGMIREELS